MIFGLLLLYNFHGYVIYIEKVKNRWQKDVVNLVGLDRNERFGLAFRLIHKIVCVNIEDIIS